MQFLNFSKYFTIFFSSLVPENLKYTVLHWHTIADWLSHFAHSFYQIDFNFIHAALAVLQHPLDLLIKSL